MYNYLRDRSRLVRLPRSINEVYLKVSKLRKANPSISTKELAEALDVDINRITETDQATQTIHSLDWEG